MGALTPTNQLSKKTKIATKLHKTMKLNIMYSRIIMKKNVLFTIVYDMLYASKKP